MTGLKSGSGDDLWDDGEDDADENETQEVDAVEDASATESSSERQGADGDAGTETATESTVDVAGEDVTETRSSTPADNGSSGGQPYIIRRAVQDKSVQFERDERLTFFVHDDVVEGERDLMTDVETALGRDVPKFDVREAVYRAALRNPDDVLDELLAMGYSRDES